jgi:hypothetical protein
MFLLPHPLPTLLYERAHSGEPTERALFRSTAATEHASNLANSSGPKPPTVRPGQLRRSLPRVLHLALRARLTSLLQPWRNVSRRFISSHTGTPGTGHSGQVDRAGAPGWPRRQCRRTPRQSARAWPFGVTGHTWARGSVTNPRGNSVRASAGPRRRGDIPRRKRDASHVTATIAAHPDILSAPISTKVCLRVGPRRNRGCSWQ